MQRLIIIIFLLFFGVSTDANAYSDEWSKILYNSVRFAEHEDGAVVDIESINNALTSGANPNYINTDNEKTETVLSRYVSIIGFSRSDDDSVKQGCKALNLLFNAGAKLGKDKSDILFFPVASGQTCIVEILLNNGARATSWDKDKIGTNLSPIEVAEANGHREIADLLINHGSTAISSKDRLQLRLIEVAGSGTLMQLQEIIRQGAQVNSANRANETALISALSITFMFTPGCAKVFYLLEQGADINLVGEGMFGETTALHQLIYSSSFVFKHGKDTSCVKELLDYFIDKGAYVSRQDNTGSTPLHLAAKYNNLYAANKLLKAGCKIMTKDFKGKTPLDLAESKEMIKLLKKYGAKEH